MFTKSLTFVLMPTAFEQHENAVELQLETWQHLLSSTAPIAPFFPASSMLLESIVLQAEFPSS